MEAVVEELKEINTRLFFWLTQPEQREWIRKQCTAENKIRKQLDEEN